MSNSFKTLGFAPQLEKLIEANGFTSPTPIQMKAIPLVRQGYDLLAAAQTGTGKTAAFVLPMLQKMIEEPTLYQKRVPRVLVLTPTRELAAQVGETILSLGKDLGVRSAVVFGGVGINPQKAAIAKGLDFLVATPGRLLDLMNQGFAGLSKTHILILDEADRMLDMGFIDDIKYVLSKLPKSRQTLLFSATMPTEIQSLSEKYMKEPEIVSVSEDILVLPNTEQLYIPIGRRNKIWALCRILEANKPKTIVFAQTKFIVDMIEKRLKSYGYPVAAIHGDLSQSKRERVLKDFRSGKTNILIATDVAARGLDIEGVTMVVNYDIPDSPETYVHRIGRTGRAGKEGRAITFVSADEMHLLEAVEAFTESKIPEFEVPTSGKVKANVHEVLDFDEMADIFGMVKIEISTGGSAGTNTAEILELLTRKAKVSEMMIGKIEVGTKTTVAEIHKSVAMRTMRTLNQLNFKGKRLGARPYKE
ncbi:DEAD/DEAH box helicase [Candidatus Methanomassiliicoccus intestinalis]|uniref:DEAD/DEAH box helicase n=1 Tax=Candidatus Methanomassiliicoccus intestinalis TaxID=1406512 RepID=UPI0037DCFF51